MKDEVVGSGCGCIGMFQGLLKNDCVRFFLFGGGNEDSWNICTTMPLISFIMGLASSMKLKGFF